MIVRGENGERRDLFALFDTSLPIPRPSEWGATLAHSGERISFDGAAGLPAFLRGVRLIAESAASLGLCVYREQRDGTKVKMPLSPQAQLFDRPNPDTPSSFAVWQYVFVSMIRGNAYLYKIKQGGRTTALYPVNPAFVTAKYDGVSPSFELRDREYGPVIETVGKDRIIHIPGILLTDPYVGVSVVEAHRHSLGNELGRQRFEGRYMANDGTPGVVLKHPGMTTPEQRREIKGSWESRHVGSGNAGRVGLLWGGWDVSQQPISLQDAQFIEAKRYGVQDIGRMLGIPASLLNDPDAPVSNWSPEQEDIRLLQHGVRPWMERLESALEADTDLFPGAGWCVEMDEDEFLRVDIKTRFDAYRLARQGGWTTANEIRDKEGLPPVEGGDQIQETPVGGAANSGGSN